MSLLMEQFINIADAVFLGHVGEIELGASALGGLYYMAVYMLGFGFSLGMQVFIGRRNGEGRFTETGKVFYQGLYFLCFLSVLIFIASRLYTPVLLSCFIHSEQVYKAVVAYMEWRDYSFLFVFPALAFRAFLVGIMQTRILSINAVFMVIVNVLLNNLLIFGKAGFPEMGIAGAALASSLSGAVAWIVLGIYAGKWISKKKYGLKPQVDISLLIRLLRLSVWTMIRFFICIAPWFLFFIAIEHLGERPLAIGNMVRSVSTLFFVVANPFATTGSALISNLLGQGGQGKVIPLCNKITKLSYAVGSPFVLGAFLFSGAILRIYTGDVSLIDAALPPYRVMLSNYFLAVPAYIFCNAVIGIGHTRTAFIFQVLTILIYGFYLYYIAVEVQVPLAVYWTAEQVYVFCLFFFSYAYLKWSKLKEKSF